MNSPPKPLPLYLSLPHSRVIGGGGGGRCLTLLTERRHLLAVLNQLHPDALADRAVGLLGLDADLLEHDALGVRGPAERRRFVGRAQETLLVVQIRPATFAAMGPQLSRRVEPTRFSFTHGCWLVFVVTVFFWDCEGVSWREEIGWREEGECCNWKAKWESLRVFGVCGSMVLSMLEGVQTDWVENQI